MIETEEDYCEAQQAKAEGEEKGREDGREKEEWSRSFPFGFP
jgi:hypothetical protein